MYNVQGFQLYLVRGYGEIMFTASCLEPEIPLYLFYFLKFFFLATNTQFSEHILLYVDVLS